MAKTYDSPSNGHDKDEDLPEILAIIDKFDNSPPDKQQKLIQRLQDLATEYKDSPNVSEVCEQVAKDLERRMSNIISTKDTDHDNQS